VLVLSRNVLTGGGLLDCGGLPLWVIARLNTGARLLMEQGQ
jgi:hypothetical protein